MSQNLITYSLLCVCVGVRGGGSEEVGSNDVGRGGVDYSLAENGTTGGNGAKV